MPKPNFAALVLFLISFEMRSDIKIDGVLNEEEWESARVVEQFYEVYPYTLNEVDDYITLVLILESEEGLYFGFKNFQPNNTMRVMNHMRDQERSISDKNGIVIDFNGDGVEGYNFFVSSSGSKGDGTVRDEKERNWDWDADWETAATVDDGVWYTESFIPWSVASMKSQSGEIRKIKMAFYRMMMGIGKGVSTIKGSPFENLYLSVFNQYEVKNYSGAKFDFFPYVTVNQDMSRSDLLSKAGTEVFWKIDSSKQVNLTLNPDFGQVESDEVVVNFSAFETFYSDRRPFFAENNNLFEMIEQGLKALAVDLGNVRIEDLSPVDEFHLGGADGTRFVIEELKKVKKGEFVDIGCGLGGPARHISKVLDRKIKGIDLTPSFVKYIKAANLSTGEVEKVTFTFSAIY